MAIKHHETFWDKKSKHWDDQIKKHASLYEKAFDGIKPLLTNSDVVLDFGCAIGEMSFKIAPHVQQVQGIDLSVKMIELANQKARDRQVENIKFNQIDAFDQSLVSNSFSVIIAFAIFHLLDDAPKVLARLNDLLATGGLLISLTPCIGEWSWFLRSIVTLFQKLGLAPTIYSLTVADLESLVSSGNFEIIETKILQKKKSVQWIVARKK